MLARRARLEPRTPLRRKTKLRTRKPMRRKARMKAVRKHTDHGDRGVLKPRRVPAEYHDPAYIAWLETQPCRVTGKVGRNVAHHLRHTSTGAPMGARIKDDRRSITLDYDVHVPQLHGNAGYFKGWSKERLRAWENEQLDIQRSQFMAQVMAEKESESRSKSDAASQ